MNSLKPRTLITVGCSLMAVRSVLQTLVDRSGHSTDLTDFGLGMLMGVGIALTLLGIWRNGRAGGSNSTCARC